MAKLGGRLGSLPFPIQKRGRGRPSKASLSNEYFLYLSAGARPRTRRDEPGVGHQQQLSPSSAILQHHQRGVGADSQAIDTGRKRRHHHHQLQKHRHHHPTSDNGSLIVATPRPQFCTPYGLAYSDHSYCKHHASGGWQRQSPQPVSQVVSPVGSAAASAAATAAAASALVAAAMATSTASSQQFGHHQQQQQQRYSFGQLDLLAQQQAFYTLNDDTDNLEINWPEEAAA